MQRTLITLALLCIVGGLVLFFVSQRKAGPDEAETPRANSANKTDSGKTEPKSGAAPSVSADAAPAGEPGDWVPEPDPRIGRTPDGKLILNQPAEMSRELHSPDTDTAADLEILDQVLWFYRKVYAENPVVENDAAVPRALLGDNPRKIVFIDPDHTATDETGALLDRFGNPYYFHAISETRMDIVSAGPDGKRGTADDFHLDPQAGEDLQLNESTE